MNDTALPRRQLLGLLAAGTGAAGVSSLLPALPVHADTAASDAWSTFCDQLKLAGTQILRPEAPADDLNRAEGWRYLSRLLRVALEAEVESSDPQFPRFYEGSNEIVKIGADNPDNQYYGARIDGRHDYRIRGSRGTVHYLLFSTKTGGYGSSGGMLPSGAIDTETLQVDADGRFEILVSATRKPGNWLPMDPKSSKLIVRQTFLDRASEKPAELQIECVDAGTGPAPLQLATVERQLIAAANYVQGTARLFADWTQRFRQAPNDFTRVDQSFYQNAGGEAAIFYAHGYWQLGADEALVIDVPATECEFWNLQIDNYWMESLDYRYYRIHLNKHSTQYRPDGSARLVLAARDPGVPNWLNTTSHPQGTLLYRVVRGSNPSYPGMRVMPLAGLREALA